MATRRPITEADARGLLRIASEQNPRDWQSSVHLEVSPGDGQIYVLRWDATSLGEYPSQSRIDAARLEADTLGRTRGQLSLLERIEFLEARLDTAGL